MRHPDSRLIYATLVLSGGVLILCIAFVGCLSSMG